jgi:hypothetical protein
VFETPQISNFVGVLIDRQMQAERKFDKAIDGVGVR